MPAYLSSNNIHWYVIHTLLKQEDRAYSNLRAWGVDAFLPKVGEARRNPFTGELSRVVKPLFPRYLFTRFNLNDSLHKVRYTRGVHSVVSFGKHPIQVDDEIMEIIKSRTDDDGFVRLDDGIRVGDEVKIIDGPFKGLLGVFERHIKGAERAMILLKTITFQARVEIQKDCIEKLKPPACAEEPRGLGIY